MAKNKNRRQEPITEKVALVSVIIPMYNAARFISQTLKSLLYQTMKDFEIIVVDDCSKDNSVEVVKSFAEKFEERLHIVSLPENSGTPSLPRNIGIQLAHGKYIAFLDSDDLFTKTALEEFSTLAETYQADIVHTDGFFYLNEDKFKTASVEELLNTKNYPVVVCNPHSPRLPKPTYAPDNFPERMHLWLNSDYHWATCSLFCRKDFLIVNQIKFSDMPLAEDIVINFHCFCRAEKILRIPEINYIYTQRNDSLSHVDNDFEKSFRKWIKGLNSGFNELNKIMNRISFFEEHSDYRYAVLNWFFEKVVQHGRQIAAAYDQIHTFQLNAFVQKEFHPDDAAFASYLFDMVNIYRLQIMELQRENAELRKFQNQ